MSTWSSARNRRSVRRWRTVLDAAPTVMNRSAYLHPPRRPADQASGLRRLFGRPRRCLLPVAANPFVPGGHALLEALSAGLAAQGRQVLVVDAASTAPAPHETALFDLAAGVERLHPQVTFAVEGHLFWLADTADNLYNVGGAARGAGANPNGFGRNPSYSSFVGSEVDVIAGYDPCHEQPARGEEGWITAARQFFKDDL